MKRILTIVAIAASTLTCFAQSPQISDQGLLSLNDRAVLFSKNSNYGTARFNAMSGTFGALGADPSAITINPAGGAVARKSSFAVTLSNRESELSANYYGNITNLNGNFSNVTQAGGILSFDNDSNSDWSRFALTINYQMYRDFDSFFEVNGNSNFLFYKEHIGDPNTIKNQFDRSLEQSFYRSTTGQRSVINFGLSAVHDKKLFVGASLNFHDIDFYQEIGLNEINDDVDGNILDATKHIENFVEGQGVSLSIGFIYKLDKSARIGLAYETPTWYQEVIDETLRDLSMPGISNLGFNETTNFDDEGPFLYSFQSPSRITASGAYVFGKKGLISVDYTFRDFTNARYSNGGFEEINQNFANNYRDTHTLNVGAEWRFDRMSIRGGYRYEKDPNLLAGGSTNIDNIKSYSFGLGYNFGGMKIDLGYQKFENTEFNSLYNTGDISIDNITTRLTGTISFSL